VVSRPSRSRVPSRGDMGETLIPPTVALPQQPPLSPSPGSVGQSHGGDGGDKASLPGRQLPAGGGGAQFLLNLAVRGGRISTEGGLTVSDVGDLALAGGGAPALADGSSGLACGLPGIGRAC
jgi:hypothetical protein